MCINFHQLMQLLNRHTRYLFASEMAKGTFPSDINSLSMQNCKSHFLWFVSSRPARYLTVPTKVEAWPPLHSGSHHSQEHSIIFFESGWALKGLRVFTLSSHCGDILGCTATLWVSVTLLTVLPLRLHGANVSFSIGFFPPAQLCTLSSTPVSQPVMGRL